MNTQLRAKPKPRKQGNCLHEWAKWVLTAQRVEEKHIYYAYNRQCKLCGEPDFWEVLEPISFPSL